MSPVEALDLPSLLSSIVQRPLLMWVIQSFVAGCATGVQHFARDTSLMHTVRVSMIARIHLLTCRSKLPRVACNRNVSKIPGNEKA